MFTIKTLPEFDDWLNSLKDRTTRLRLNKRLRKAMLGNLGDVKTLSNGLFEMREHFGPGWRMYYTKRENVLILMLGGGNKGSQAADIAVARQRASLLED